MAQTGNVEVVASDPATQFLAAISQNAAAYLDLLLPESISAGRTCRSVLRGISIQSVENTGWEIWLYTKKRTGAEAIGDVAFLGYWTFIASTALQIGATGLYYYYVDGLAVPYWVEDRIMELQGNGQVVSVPDDNGQRRYLHMALVARESAKSANAAGAVRVQFILEPSLGW